LYSIQKPIIDINAKIALIYIDSILLPKKVTIKQTHATRLVKVNNHICCSAQNLKQIVTH